MPTFIYRYSHKQRILCFYIPTRLSEKAPVSALRNPLVQWRPQVRRYATDYPPHTRVNLPALSPTMEMGTIISWEKKEGDKLNEGDLLAEIETDKATMGFETPEEGYLAKIVIPAGTKEIPIGKLVCIIVENEADVAAFKDFKDEGAAAAAPAAAKPAPAAAEAAPAPQAAVAPPVPPPQAPAVPQPPAAAEGSSRVYASPMAKRLAEQRNIRLQGEWNLRLWVVVFRVKINGGLHVKLKSIGVRSLE